ncbi:MAG: phage integrase N-terminal SAM-like domain-containing protein, partial [Chloroflexales bacterium]|nr:phage integrase N-terminal SAM-like domain-containing protein [Chloroflexales bacterium]
DLYQCHYTRRCAVGLAGNTLPNDAPPRLLDRVRQALRVKQYALRTEEAYVGWIKRYVLFHNKRPPQAMGMPESAAFRTNRAVTQRVAVVAFTPFRVAAQRYSAFLEASMVVS